MIKISKKVTFFLMTAMIIGLSFSLRNVNWENVNEGFYYKELRISFACLSLSIYFILYYVRILKLENK
jgi:hypothetical protein